MADSAQGAMQQGMEDARRRMSFYGDRPGVGVQVGTTGSNPEPLPVPADPPVTGVGRGEGR